MAKLQNFLLRPRYLRAIPSLVVLTTAMAWGVAPDPDVTDTLSKKAGVMQTQGGTGVPAANRWLKVR